MGALTIFLGSFLAFFVEPLVGRTLLPSFGGGAAVWVTCLVGFQLLMVGGYFYGGRVKVRPHVCLLALAALWCWAIAFWRRPLLGAVEGLSGVPAVDVLLGVVLLSGLSFVLLSANATLVQMLSGGNYRLYAFSNLGSFFGLLAYPLAVEPFVPVAWQWGGLGLAIVLYGVGLVAMTRWEGRRFHRNCPAGGDDGAEGTAVSSKPPYQGAWLWFVLPAASCALMTAVTTHLTTDFAPLPLVWAVILALFLLSYVIGFSRAGSEYVGAWVGAGVVAFLVSAFALVAGANNMGRFYWNAGAAVALLLVVGTALHSWLYALRPNPVRLPFFYFAIAVGGAVGGLAAGIVAPLVFDQVWEYPLVLLLCAGLFAFLLCNWPNPTSVNLNRIGLGLLLVGALVILHSMRNAEQKDVRTLCRERGFYGVNVVTSSEVEYGLEGKRGDFHVYKNGSTEHGAQIWAEGVKSKPRSYYSLNGGTVPFLEHPKRKAGQPLRAAFVGMGIGSLAACGETGDYFRFYEISPEVIGIATNAGYFTFLSDSRAKCDIVLGDARLEFERDRAAGVGKFDLIFIDAYSGDSIPTHLITSEAFDLYRSMLAGGGILACHLSNWHMNLWPVMKAAARHLGLEIYGWVSGPVYSELVCGTYWALMTEKPMEPRLPDCCHIVDFSRVGDQTPITDDCGSLIFNIRFNYFPPYLYE